MVRIMTDNAANLPKHLLEQYGIGELCLTYTIDGQPADISAEFDGRSFYEAMRHGAVVQTSMVTPDAARREMEPHLKNGDDVLYIGLSSGVSGTCWGVGLVAKELAEEYPDRKIRAEQPGRVPGRRSHRAGGCQAGGGGPRHRGDRGPL